MADTTNEQAQAKPKKEEKKPETLTPREWATRKGHIPRPGPVAASARAHRGPVYAFVSDGVERMGPIALHMFDHAPIGTRWYLNSQLTEDQYNAGVEAALGLKISAAPAAKKAAPAAKKAS